MASRKHRIKKRFLLLAIFIAASVLLAFFELEYSNAYYPGITINGRPVSGMTQAQAEQEFKTTADALSKNGLAVTLEGRGGQTQIIIPANASGLTPDTVVEYFSIANPAQTVADAYAWGRTGTLVTRLGQQTALLIGKNFDIPVQAYAQTIRSLLERQTRPHIIAKVPAQFSVDKNGNVTIVPEILGENVDMEQMLGATLEKINTLEPGPVIVGLQSQAPYATGSRLEPFWGLAKTIAATPGITFEYKNHTWNVSGKKLATWLTVKPNNQITVDTEKLEAFLAVSAAPYIGNPPENSRFKMVDGKLVETLAGTPGNVINIDKAGASIQEIISKTQKADGQEDTTAKITLETISVEPKVTQKTIDQYHIKDFIGSATTNFTGGSADRQHNIEVGVSKITGMIIAPGEEFSTVDAIGRITEEAGFVKEYVISGDQTVKELGGGLCQLATTLFRTALNAGMPVTERINHKYVIPYYGPGLDATIYGPHPDFRFVNDTGNYLLLQGTAKNNEATFELYGVADGRSAKVSTPALSNEQPVPPDRNILSPNLPLGQVTCTIATHKGITADTAYTVNYPDGTTKRTIFHSVYEAWPRVCLVGTRTP